MPSDFRKPRLEGGHEKLRRFDRSSLARHTNAVSPPSRVRAVWSSPAIEDEHTMKLRLVGLVWACSWSCLILAARCRWHECFCWCPNERNGGQLVCGREYRNEWGEQRQRRRKLGSRC